MSVDKKRMLYKITEQNSLWK